MDIYGNGWPGRQPQKNKNVYLILSLIIGKLMCNTLILSLQMGLPMPRFVPPQATPRRAPICQRPVGKLGLSIPAVRRVPDANRVKHGLGR